MKLFELGVEMIFNNLSAVIHHKVDLLNIPLLSIRSKRTNDAFALLIFVCHFHL